MNHKVNILFLRQGNSSGRSPGQRVMLVVGLAATVAVTVYATCLTLRGR